MVSLTALWLPIVLSAVVVFVASSIIHMVLRYHERDYGIVPDEANVLEAMRKAGLSPGSYFFPHPGRPPKHDEETKKKFVQGPVGFMNVLPSGPPGMGKQLVSWFVFSVVVGILVAYVTGRTLEAGAHYLQVFRVAGAVSFLTWAGAVPIDSIWKGRPWAATLRDVADGLIYGLLTAGVFGWLWPA